MDEKYRHLLERNHYLLSTNITLTDEMYDKLSEMNVLTRTMVQDIKSKEVGERVNYMLELLTKRPKAAYKQFCSVLQLCNHVFLSDHMLQEEAFPQNDGININDLFWRVPSLQKHLHNKEKEILLTYVQQKVREEVNKSQWQSSPAMKASAMTIRANHIDQIEKYKGLLVQKEAQTHSLEVKLKDAEEGAERETHRLMDNLKALKHRYDNDVTIQMKHAEAGERSIHRLSDNLFHLENQVWAVNKLIRKALGETAEEIEWDPLNKSTETLETNAKALIEKYSNLRAFSSEIETINEKDEMVALNLLRIQTGKDVGLPFTDIIREYTETLNKAMDDTISELNKLDQSLKPKSLDFKFITETNEEENITFCHYENKPITSTIVSVKRELKELTRRANELQNELHEKVVKVGDLNHQVLFLQSELSKARCTKHNLLEVQNGEQKTLNSTQSDRIKLPSLSPAGSPLTSPFVTPNTSPVLSRKRLTPHNHALPLNSPPPKSSNGLIDVTISPRSGSYLGKDGSTVVSETNHVGSPRQRTLSFTRSDINRSRNNILSPHHTPTISRSPSPRRKLESRDTASPHWNKKSPLPNVTAKRKTDMESNGHQSMINDQNKASLTNICFDEESANRK